MQQEHPLQAEVQAQLEQSQSPFMMMVGMLLEEVVKYVFVLRFARCSMKFTDNLATEEKGKTPIRGERDILIPTTNFQAIIPSAY